jgi:hypothetical protein
MAKHSIVCQQSADPKSVLYANALPLINARRCELPDVPRIRAQLIGLERRTRSGRDAIDHAPGGRDDLANVVAGGLCLAVSTAAQSNGDIIAANLSAAPMRHGLSIGDVGDVDAKPLPLVDAWDDFSTLL